MSPLRAPYTPGADERQGPFVVLEGVSGVGKSTLARLLAKRLDATAIHTLTDPHTGCSDTVNRELRPLPQFAFYLSGLLHVSDAVRHHLGTGPVIADRYASSVMACHAAVNQVGLDQVRELISPFLPYLVAPDATFYLVISDSSLRERMGTKTDVKQDDTDLFDVPGRLARLRENFQSVAETDPSVVTLPTDDRSPDELADIIVKHLEGRRV
ncbi:MULTISPECIES: thymidylate kinase [unclassified Streptomyces]|uniref:dTMP kinase n=1 Tax=unclassified Streptomyces TaxID=2593676 RepID=UPI002E77BB52|nr:thymidylate kinase [Streptomyces sp. JV176]MEE1803237.1 thymidylate kinase [Streptomyces sp. JV176]